MVIRFSEVGELVHCSHWYVFRYFLQFSIFTLSFSHLSFVCKMYHQITKWFIYRYLFAIRNLRSKNFFHWLALFVFIVIRINNKRRKLKFYHIFFVSFFSLKWCNAMKFSNKTRRYSSKVEQFNEHENVCFAFKWCKCNYFEDCVANKINM